MTVFNSGSLSRTLALGLLLLATTQCGMRETISERPGGTRTTEASRPAVSPRVERKETRASERIGFGMNLVDDARLADVDIRAIRQAADLSADQQAKLQAAQQSSVVPLRLSLRVYARNPTNAAYKVSMVAYEVRIDDQAVASGTTGTSMVLDPHSIVTLPIVVAANVAPALTGTTAAAFASGLTDLSGTPPRLTLRVLPTFISPEGHLSQPAEFVVVPIVGPKSPQKLSQP
jgi:hypothetical protein